ncbi:MAG: coproporphyrinogen dehydrogenase HemZ [Angelakisella sp.]|nr:coproporphyrinogen dehydrogenase HemZ [Angelakisella sp.]
MIVCAPNEKFHYELEAIIRMFLPDCKVHFQERAQGDSDYVKVKTTADKIKDNNYNTVTLKLEDREESLSETCSNTDRETELSICRLLYQLLSKFTGHHVEWGILTGIRPVKLIRQMREEGYTETEIVQRFTKSYLVSEDKVQLCLETDKVQRPVIESALPKGYSLYVSIPFCPSRCSYCSFVSHSIEKTWKLIPEYLEKLCEELRHTANLVKEKGLLLQSVYVGGGTPTVLSAEQLRVLLAAVRQYFDFTLCQEFTVEAGRPDTIDLEKLIVLKEMGVDRISINTQSLNDEILQQIGRKHTVKEFLKAYEQAKMLDFTAINVDLIAGLSGETTDSFCKSLDQVIELEPENITVHALTVKRAATIRDEKSLHLNGISSVGNMINYSQKKLFENGWKPYYMYRQKSTIDSLENVGFAKDGTTGIYNIFIMDETHTILSVGGGGVTKLVLPNGGKIHRIFNYKYPYEYISRFEQLLQRKEEIMEFPL